MRNRILSLLYSIVRLVLPALFLSVAATTLSAEEASDDFYQMFDDIGDEFYSDHHGKYEHCEATVFNWGYQAINNVYGERVFKVSFFDPMIKSVRTLLFMTEGMNRFIAYADAAIVAGETMLESHGFLEFLGNYVHNATALFIKKAVAKGAARVARDQLVKLGVNAEIAETMDAAAISESLLEIYKSNDEFINTMRQLWDTSKDKIKGEEKIAPIIYENAAGCETKISALWDKDREVVVITINSECDCDKALSASAGQNWTPIREGNMTIIANVYPVVVGDDKVRWTAKMKSLKYGYQCCDGTDYVSRGIYVEPSQQDSPNDEAIGNDGEDKSNFADKSTTSAPMSEKKKKYLERQRIGKLCETEYKKRIEELAKEWRDKRKQLVKDYDKQIKGLEEEQIKQQSVYDAAMKKHAHVQAMVDAENDPSLSYCEELARKQERMSEDIRFHSERLIRAESRRGQCSGNCDYIKNDIAKIKQEISRLKQERSELEAVEKECKKGAKGLKDQLPALKNKKGQAQQRLDEIGKLLTQYLRSRQDALQEIDHQYKAASAALSESFDDCKKSGDGKFKLPDYPELTTKGPKAYDFSGQTPMASHETGTGFDGMWLYGPYSVVEFREESGKLAAYWKQVGPAYTVQYYEPEMKLLEGGVQGNTLTGKYNFKAVDAMIHCPDDWDQWVPISMKLGKNGSEINATIRNIGIEYIYAKDYSRVIECKPATNTRKIILFRTDKIPEIPPGMQILKPERAEPMGTAVMESLPEAEMESPTYEPVEIEPAELQELSWPDEEPVK